MRKKGSFLIAAGLLLLAAALLLTLYNVWDARRADRASQSALLLLRERIPGMEAAQPTGEAAEIPPGEAAAPSCAPETAEPEEAPTLPQGDREMPTVEINGYRYIGVLEVPIMGLSLPVMEEWDYDRLKVAPCRFSGNVYHDDLVICAHNYPMHFSPLKYAPIGTQVRFTDADGLEFCYTVSSLDTVGPNDVETMVSGDWDLTLFTCDTGGQTRCAVRCDRIS